MTSLGHRLLHTPYAFGKRCREAKAGVRPCAGSVGGCVRQCDGARASSRRSIANCWTAAGSASPDEARPEGLDDTLIHSGAAQRRFRGDAGAGDEHGRLLAAAGVPHGALAAGGTPAAGAAVRQPPGGVRGHGRTHDAAAGPGGPGRAAGAGRQLPACAAVAAPQADGAAELGPPRRPVPPRRVPPGLDALREGPDDRRACRRTVDLLALAHDRCCEAQLAAEIERGLGAGELPDAKVLRDRFLPPPESLPAIGTEVPALSEYDDACLNGELP